MHVWTILSNDGPLGIIDTGTDSDTESILDWAGEGAIHSMVKVTWYFIKVRSNQNMLNEIFKRKIFITPTDKCIITVKCHPRKAQIKFQKVETSGELMLAEKLTTLNTDEFRQLS